MRAGSRGGEPQTLPRGKYHDLLPVPPPPSCRLWLPHISVLPYRGLLRQEGSPWHSQPFLRASGTGTAGSRAAAALSVAFSAQTVSSLTRGRDGVEKGYRALSSSFPLQGRAGQLARLVSAGQLFISLLQHVAMMESCAGPGHWARWSLLHFPNAVLDLAALPASAPLPSPQMLEVARGWRGSAGVSAALRDSPHAPQPVSTHPLSPAPAIPQTGRRALQGKLGSSPSPDTSSLGRPSAHPLQF